MTGGVIEVRCPLCGVIGQITYFRGVVIHGMHCGCGAVAVATNHPIQKSNLPTIPNTPIQEPECNT